MPRKEGKVTRELPAELHLNPTEKSVLEAFADGLDKTGIMNQAKINASTYASTKQEIVAKTDNLMFVEGFGGDRDTNALIYHAISRGIKDGIIKNSHGTHPDRIGEVETQIMRLRCDGKSDNEIAAALGIPDNIAGLRAIMANIVKKMGVPNLNAACAKFTGTQMQPHEF